MYFPRIIIDLDISDIFSLYAAMMSTLAFIWGVHLYRTLDKIRIKMVPEKRFVLYRDENGEDSLQLVLTCFITNVGRVNTKVLRPQLQTHPSINNDWNLEIYLEDAFEWPKELPAQDDLQRDIPLDLIQSELNDRKVKKFRFVVRTTSDKVFYSNWISYRYLFESDESMDILDTHPGQ